MTSAGPSLEAHRLRKHADYQRVYQDGRKRQGALMAFFSAPRVDRRDAGPRIGFTTGKALGKAVARNRIRRRTKEAVRRNLHELIAPVDLVLHPRRAVLEVEFTRLERDVVRILRQVQSSFSPESMNEKR